MANREMAKDEQGMCGPNGVEWRDVKMIKRQLVGTTAEDCQLIVSRATARPVCTTSTASPGSLIPGTSSQNRTLFPSPQSCSPYAGLRVISIHPGPSRTTQTHV